MTIPQYSYGPLEARYYDATYALLRDPAGDAAFYLALARETGGPVLELGCGTGRVLLPIARAGIAAVGVDRSAEMLAVLRKKAPPTTLRLVPASMTDFDLGPERFRLVFSAFRALQHLCSVDEQLACLARVRRHLAPDGLFAFDVFSPDLRRLADPDIAEQEDARFADDGDEVIRYVRTVPDPAAQVIQVRFRYERRRGERVMGDDVVEIPMRWFTRWELEHLLARAGFAIVACYGGFDRRPYDRTAPDIVVVARAA